MNRLDEIAFKATFRGPMQRVGDNEAPPFDYWPYFEQIPNADFEGFDCAEGQVDWAWRTVDGCFEHVLINTVSVNCGTIGFCFRLRASRD